MSTFKIWCLSLAAVLSEFYVLNTFMVLYGIVLFDFAFLQVKLQAGSMLCEGIFYCTQRCVCLLPERKNADRIFCTTLNYERLLKALLYVYVPVLLCLSVSVM